MFLLRFMTCVAMAFAFCVARARLGSVSMLAGRFLVAGAAFGDVVTVVF